MSIKFNINRSYSYGHTFYLLSELNSLFYLLRKHPYHLESYKYWLILNKSFHEIGTLSNTYGLMCEDFLIKL